MNIFKHICFALLLLGYGITLKAQSFYAINIDREQGLPANEVYDIYQDGKGFLWAATDEGLTRFDGTNFKSYKSNDQYYVAGSNIKEDHFGRVWYQNFDGQVYYTSGDSLRRFFNSKSNGFFPFAISDNAIIKAENGIISAYDLYSFKLLKRFSIEDNMLLSTSASKNNFYVLTERSLIKIDAQLKEQSIKLSSIKETNFNLVFTSENRVFLISIWDQQQQVFVLDDQLQLLHVLKLPVQALAHQCVVLDNQYWVLTNNGIFKYDTLGQFKEQLYEGFSISKVLKDIQGNYWFASNKSGLQIVPNFKDRFVSIADFVPKQFHIFKSDYFWIDDKGTFWKSDSNLLHFKKVYQDGLSTPIAYSFLDNKTGKIVYASKGTSFNVLPSFANNQHTKIALKDVAIIDDKYWVIATNTDFALMKVANANSLKSIWDSVYDNHPKLNLVDAARISQQQVRGRAIAYNNKEQAIYASGNVGLYRFSRTGSEEIKNNGTDFFAKALFAFDDKNYAIDTRGCLFQFDAKGRFNALSKSLQISETIRLAKAFGQYLFLVTDGFVYRFDMNLNAIAVVNININTREISDLNWNGHQLILLTDKGLVQKSELFDVNNFEPKLIVDKVLIDGKTFDFEKEITVPNKASKMQIYYAVPEFGNALKHKCFYRIDNGPWQLIASNSQFLELLSLPDGKHILQFKIGSKIQDNIINFEVLVPFWKKWWFILCMILVAALTTAFIYRQRLERLRKRIGLLEEKVILEQELGKSIVKSVKAQMNPHFFYNALNTIQAYIYLNDKVNAGKYLSKFSELTRKILAMSEKESISLSEEIETLKLYLELEKMRFEDGLEIEFEVDEILNTTYLKIPTMLIQPFVENAIKHGLLHKRIGEKAIRISFEQNDNFLKVSIADNGVGRAKAASIAKAKNVNHQSFSTEANNKRIEVLNKHSQRKIELQIIDKYDDNGNAKGTLVLIFIPIIS